MADYQSCVREVRRQLATLRDAGAVVDEHADLVEEVGLESVEVMELIEELEDVFDIAFPLNDLADIRTISDLATSVLALAGPN